MITFFTTGKPFRGHDGIIQRNALKSWTLVDPDVEVILFGDDEGAAQVSADLGLRHEPHVERHESGTKYVNYLFKRASEIARHKLLCFANCDIILMSDFANGAAVARSWRDQFLLVAKRWDTDVVEPIDFHHPSWAHDLREFARTKGFRQDEYWIDLFLFPKGLYTDMPPLIVGHCYWDNWMIWKALSTKTPVLDASSFVMPIHQNHGYNPKFGRIKGVASDALSAHNLQVMGGAGHVRQLDSATYRITSSGRVRVSFARYKSWCSHALLKLWKVLYYRIWRTVWHSVLDATRPLRSLVGLRSKSVRERQRS